MEWIKVTPETMPPDGEAVIVSVKHDFGDGHIGKWTEANIRHTQGKGWEYLANSYDNEWWYYSGGRDITYWAHMPEPVMEDGELVEFVQCDYTGKKTFHLKRMEQ